MVQNKDAEETLPRGAVANNTLRASDRRSAAMLASTMGPATVLILLCTLALPLGAAAAPGSARDAAPPSACRAGQLQAVLARARGMRKEQLGFWLRHGVDEQYGGFHAVRCNERARDMTRRLTATQGGVALGVTCMCQPERRAYRAPRWRPRPPDKRAPCLHVPWPKPLRLPRARAQHLHPQTLNRGGAVGAPTDKGVVQQARHAWTFAHAAASGLLRNDPAAQAGAERAARSAWRFMTDHMQRPQAPGTWCAGGQEMGTAQRASREQLAACMPQPRVFVLRF